MFCEKNIKRTQTAYGYNYNSSPYCMLVYNTEWELNDDSIYYIGVVNTTVTTDTMFQYNAYTVLQCHLIISGVYW